MAQIDVRTTVSAPQEINIPLVRADHAGTANTFRTFFEIFLAVFSAFLGHILSLEAPEPMHWVVLIIFGLAAAAFLLICILYSRSAKNLPVSETGQV